MANSAQAAKRARQAVKRRSRNMPMRSKLRSAIAGTVRALDAGDAEKAAAAYRKATPIIDAMVGKGVIHANKAARHKSRLNKRLKALSPD
ncbi:30S ribosomal protein S20 [Candidatus Foliamicus sp.]